MSTVQSAQPLTAQQMRVSPAGDLREIVRSAARRTDTDFDFLLAQAHIESSLDPEAKANTSSAAGLFQFINQTWLGTLKRHGGEHGYEWAANGIETRNGRATVIDPVLRQKVMELRFDPLASSLMAGELAQDNAGHLARTLGRPADTTELYLAHLLGPKGAETFAKAHAATPAISAASVFPQAARANTGLFYTSNGDARSLSELREIIAHKLDTASVNSAPVQASGQASQTTNPAEAFASFSGENDAISHRQAVAAPAEFARTAPPARASMAQVLQQTFSPSDSGQTPAHVDRAYRAISRFGL